MASIRKEICYLSNSNLYQQIKQQDIMGINVKQIHCNIKFLFRCMLLILLVSSILEIIFFPSIKTLFCILSCFIGVLIQKSVFKVNSLIFYPVSTIAILMYVLFFIILPMPATLIEFKPVTYNLHNPYETYLNILILESLLLITHNVYIHLSGRNNPIRDILFRLPCYKKLTSSELWCLIIFSFILYVYIILEIGLYDENSENTNRHLPTFLYVLNLLIGGFYVIILIFYFRKLDVIKNKNYRINNILIIFISAIAFIVGVATNMRTAAISVVSVGVFIYIYYWIFYLNKNIIKPKYIIICVLAIWFFFGPFMALSRSMVLVRHQRAGMNGKEMLEMTFSGLSEKSKNISKETPSTFYSEEYLSNDILNRFCSIKILDENLYRAHDSGYGNINMQEHFVNTLYSYIPGFIKKSLNLNLKEVNGSLTDVLAYEAKSSPYIGGVKIGTLQGLGLSLFGWWYIPLVFLFYIPIFYLMDTLICYKNGKMNFSWIFLCGVVSFAYWFSDRHYYVWECRFLMRGYIEMVFFSNITIFLIKRLPFIKH